MAHAGVGFARNVDLFFVVFRVVIDVDVAVVDVVVVVHLARLARLEVAVVVVVQLGAFPGLGPASFAALKARVLGPGLLLSLFASFPLHAAILKPDFHLESKQRQFF